MSYEFEESTESIIMSLCGGERRLLRLLRSSQLRNARETVSSVVCGLFLIPGSWSKVRIISQAILIGRNHCMQYSRWREAIRYWLRRFFKLI